MSSDVVATADAADPHAPAPLLVLDVVEDFLDRYGLGTGAIVPTRIGEGQSNVTYRLDRADGSCFVLRRGPRPPLPRSTHDMVREARVLDVLARRGVPTATVRAVCDDAALLGVPFYVMDLVDGVVVTGEVPPALAAEPETRRLGELAVDELVRLHRVEVADPEVASLGRPDGYLERQVRRFADLWPQVSERELPEVALLAEWLGAHLPRTTRHAVVHGDYRLGNLMFASDPPARVAAILDWEMATLGDPLADLGYLVATWAEPGVAPTPMELSPVTRGAGFLRRHDLVERYAAQLDLDDRALPWYETLALWKSAVFCEAIYTRWVRGERPDDDGFGPSLRDGVPRLLDAARAATVRGA